MMVSPDYVRLMARYAAWQNDSLMAAADTLTDDQRREDRGAFFGSIHRTMSHLVWGDRMWMHRLAGHPKPDAGSVTAGLEAFDTWEALKGARASQNTAMIDWSDSVTEKALSGTLIWYSGAYKREMTHPRGALVTHMFNHGTHHRGQIHTLLTQLGAAPDDTDIPVMPARYQEL